MTEQTSQGSLVKVFIILAIVGIIGATVVGAGTYLFLNRDKYFSKADSSEEPPAPAETTEAAAPGTAAQAVTGLPLDKLRAARQSVVASAPIPANQRTYASYAGRNDVLVLVDYYADWCGPCRGIAPSLARLASTHGDKVVVLKVNVDREKVLAQRAGVSSIPDVRLLHAGQQLERVIGGRSYRDYESMILKHASRLSKSAVSNPAVSNPAVSNPAALKPAVLKPAVLKPAASKPAASKPAANSPAAPASPGGSITPMKEDWLPPGVERIK